MKLPLQITFRQIEPSAALEARIPELAPRLEKFNAQITSCRVVVEPLSHHQQQGALFDIRINITLPRHEISIRRAHPSDHSHENPYVALESLSEIRAREIAMVSDPVVSSRIPFAQDG